jgi:hypothetical protein
MKTSNSAPRILIAALTIVALGAVAIASTGCSSATSQAPAPQAVAATTPAPAAAAPAPAAATAPAPAGPAAVGPTAALGKTVVASSCVGQCHSDKLINYRTSAAGAQRIATSMGRRVGLPAEKQQAIALYFAQ